MESSDYLFFFHLEDFKNKGPLAGPEEYSYTRKKAFIYLLLLLLFTIGSPSIMMLFLILSFYLLILHLFKATVLKVLHNHNNNGETKDKILTL